MKIGGNMKGYRLNKDIEYVKKIMQGIERKNGHCPCRLKEDEGHSCRNWSKRTRHLSGIQK